MEDRFGSSVTSIVPTAVQKLAIQGRSFDKHIIDRMLKWFNMLTSKQQDKYISLLLKDLNADFIKTTGKTIMMANNTMTTEYIEYFLDYCECIARSCEQTNIYVTHLQSGQHQETSEIGFFDPATDKAMTLFYNALIGTQKVILIMSTTARSTVSVP